MTATQYSDLFVEKAMSRLEGMQARRRQLLAQVQGIQEEMRTLENESTQLMALLNGYIDFMGLNGEARQSHEPRRAHFDLPRGAYAQLVYEALVALGGTATLGSIVEHLRSTDRIPEAEHSYYSTRSALNRHSGIAKGDGVYRLKELAEQATSDVA